MIVLSSSTFTFPLMLSPALTLVLLQVSANELSRMALLVSVTFNIVQVNRVNIYSSHLYKVILLGRGPTMIEPSINTSLLAPNSSSLRILVSPNNIATMSSLSHQPFEATSSSMSDESQRDIQYAAFSMSDTASELTVTEQEESDVSYTSDYSADEPLHQDATVWPLASLTAISAALTVAPEESLSLSRAVSMIRSNDCDQASEKVASDLGVLPATALAFADLGENVHTFEPPGDPLCPERVSDYLVMPCPETWVQGLAELTPTARAVTEVEVRPSALERKRLAADTIAWLRQRKTRRLGSTSVIAPLSSEPLSIVIGVDEIEEGVGVGERPTAVEAVPFSSEVANVDQRADLLDRAPTQLRIARQRSVTPPCPPHVILPSLTLTDAFETQAVYLHHFKGFTRSCELWDLSRGESEETLLERRRDSTIDTRRAMESSRVAMQWVEATSTSTHVKVVKGPHGLGLESIAAVKARVPLSLHGLLVRTGRDWADTDCVWQVTDVEIACKLGCSILGPIALTQSGCEHCANVHFTISKTDPSVVDCVTCRVINVGDILCAEYPLGFPDATCVRCRRVALRHHEEGQGRVHRGAIPKGWSRLTRNCESDGMLRSYYWRWDNSAARGIKLQWEFPNAVGAVTATPFRMLKDLQRSSRSRCIPSPMKERDTFIRYGHGFPGPTLANGRICIKASTRGGVKGRGLFAGPGGLKRINKEDRILYSGDVVDDIEAGARECRGDGDYLLQLNNRDDSDRVDGQVFATAISQTPNADGDYFALDTWARNAGPGSLMNHSTVGGNATFDTLYHEGRHGFQPYRVIRFLMDIAEGEEIVRDSSRSQPPLEQQVLVDSDEEAVSAPMRIRLAAVGPGLLDTHAKSVDARRRKELASVPRLSVGIRVLAKWGAGTSSAQWLPGIISRVYDDPSSITYDVQFSDDDTVQRVLARYIK